jgi:hypothetical protein
MTEPELPKLARSASHSRRGSHRAAWRIGRLWSAWWAEILIGLLLALGVFLLVERMQIRQTLLRWLQQAGSALLGLARTTQGRLVDFVQSRTHSDLIGILLLVAAFGIIAWRVRWRLLNNPRFTDRSCPRCGGTLHRVHRRGLDHALNAMVPVRRYRCGNPECRWHGLRFGGAHQG